MTLTWPDTERFVFGKIAAGVTAARTLTAILGRSGTVLQAGGCLGLWPRAFAEAGWHVITCEPAPDNLPYLSANLEGQITVEIVAAALGRQAGTTGLTRHKVGAGLWTCVPGATARVTTIDAICESRSIDALVLDIEGSELAALDGAERTVARDRPLIWLERRLHTEAIDAWLVDHGYREPIRVSHWDVLAIPLDRPMPTV
jgi:FkbM family methyltransferase